MPLKAILILIVLVVFSGCASHKTPELVGEPMARMSLDACVGHPGFSKTGLSQNCESRRPDFPELIILDTPEVRHFINYFQVKRRRFMAESLERGSEHWTDMTQILGRYGLPKRLVGVALVESGFKEAARSRRGAVGMWQIMPRTARYLGLTVNLFVDQRKDAKKSTAAAARYLAELYQRYGDWYLALAAYNAGPTRVSRAVRQANSRDFFVLARKGLFKKETAQFVPKVLAAALISANPKRFGFHAAPNGVDEPAGVMNELNPKELARVEQGRNRL